MAGAAAVLAVMAGAASIAQEAPERVTPMDERVAVVSVLDKVSGDTADYEVRPGDRIKFRALNIRLVACETTPPWAQMPQTGAFVQVDKRRNGGGVARIFSGWLFAESPSLNSVDDPNYDVWVKSCAMSFPESGPDTILVN